MATPLFLVLVGAATAFARPGPAAWWRFENASAPGANSGTAGEAADLTFPAPGDTSPSFAVEAAGGAVGGWLKVDGSNASINVSASAAAPLPASGGAPGLTVEFLISLNPDGFFNLRGNTTVLASSVSLVDDERWEVVLDRHSLGFRAAGRVLSVPLNGAPPATYWAIHDGKWHHVAFKLDAATGEASAWVDGACAPGFRTPPNASTAPGKVPPGAKGPIRFLPTAFDGGIDEVAVWAEALSNGTIWAHYNAAVVKHQPYPLTPSPAHAPPPPPPGPQFVVTDFASGTILPTPIGNATFGVTATPVEQLKVYPSPRFLAKPATGKGIGVQQRNFNWGAPNDYMAGSPYNYYIPTAGRRPPENETALVVAALQEELATTWNYNLQFLELGRSGCKGPSVDRKGNPVPASCDVKLQAMINLSNAHPEWGVDTVFQRMGARVCADPANRTTCEKGWRYTNQTLPDGCYFQDAHGNFLSLTGTLVNTSDPKSLKVLRPTTEGGATAHGCPDGIFDADVEAYRTGGLVKKYGGYKGTVSRINNDGEYNVIYMCAASNGVFEEDPVVVKDYDASEIPKLPSGQRDWPTFASRWRARFSNKFSDALTSDPQSPELKGALFSEYQVQGDTLFFGVWNETRRINTPVTNGGVLRYYSAGDIYPWIQAETRFTGLGPHHNLSVTSEAGTPSWDVTHGSWHGADWLMQIVPSQVAAGDVVWSPFVAAGWSEREELNARPAQWLGLLKLLTVTGAEWFYFGFFSLHPPFPDARNWVWQGAAPVYAQAVASHWLDVLYNGELLEGDAPVPPISCQVMQNGSDPMQWVPKSGVEHCQAPTQPYVSYRFWAGSQSNVVMVRKLKGSEKYVIVGTVQPQSNVPSNAPLTAAATIRLPSGGKVKLELRRQGSVYIFENDTKPVLTLVDEWHEATHFARWSKDIALEAELHDDHTARSDAYPRVTERPDGADADDFTRFVTYVEVGVTPHSPARLRFAVRPRAGNGAAAFRTYEALVRCRVVKRESDGAGATGPRAEVAVTTGLDTGAVVVDSSRWHWRTVPGRFRVRADDDEAFVELAATGVGTLHVDAVKLRDVDA